MRFRAANSCVARQRPSEGIALCGTYPVLISDFLHCQQTVRIRFDFRCMSAVRSPTVPPVISGTAVSKDETRSFMAVFPDVVRDLTDTGRNLDIPDVTKWLAKVWIIWSDVLAVFNIFNYCYFSCCNTMYQAVRRTVG